MNALSWLIYLAGVAENFHGASGFLVFIGCLACVGFGVASHIPIWMWMDAKDDHRRYPRLYPDPPGDNPGPLGWMVRASVWGGVSAIALVVVSVAVPSKDTVYAIAASEVGEEVVKSETASKAIKALNAWLDKQITPTEKKD